MIIDIDSHTYRCIKKHIDGRIGEIQRQLEVPCEPEMTAQLRGRIAELRALVGYFETPAKPHGPDKNFSTPPQY